MSLTAQNISDNEPTAKSGGEPQADATRIAGRVIVELDINGKLWMEHYANGQRQRTLLDRGNEWWNIVDELHIQRKRSIDADARAKLKHDETVRRRHRNVWIDAAENHGIGFAKNTIKGDVPIGYGRYLAPEDKPRPKTIPGPKVEDLMDLL